MAAVAAPAVVVVAAAAVDEWCLHLGEKMDASHGNPTKAAIGPKTPLRLLQRNSSSE